MDRKIFFNTQLWLCRLDENVTSQLLQSFKFHTIVSNALCCFQIDRKPIFFNSACDGSLLGNTTTTSLDIKIAIPLENAVSSAVGLFFIMNCITYLVDHTAMGPISIPRISNESKEPPSIFFIWPGVQMRIWVPTVSNTAGKQMLSQAITEMNRNLIASHLHHPNLSITFWTRPSPLTNSTGSDTNCDSDSEPSASALIEPYFESWSQLPSAVEALVRKRPSLDCLKAVITDSDVHTSLHHDTHRASKRTLPTDPVPGSDPNRSTCRVLYPTNELFDAVGERFLSSLLDPDTHRIIEARLECKRQCIEKNIVGLLDEMFPSTPIPILTPMPMPTDKGVSSGVSGDPGDGNGNDNGVGQHTDGGWRVKSESERLSLVDRMQEQIEEYSSLAAEEVVFKTLPVVSPFYLRSELEPEERIG